MAAQLTLLVVLCLAGCSAYRPLDKAPPTPDRPWKGPDLARVSGQLGTADRAKPSETISREEPKRYALPELIDLAQRTNPETRVAWERARQAAIAAGIAVGTYYPRLTDAATAALASVPAPIPDTVVPGGVFRADTRFVIPGLSLE